MNLDTESRTQINLGGGLKYWFVKVLWYYYIWYM